MSWSSRGCCCAGYASYASCAGRSGYTSRADCCGYSNWADCSDYSSRADCSDYSSRADCSGYASIADCSSYANRADCSGCSVHQCRLYAVTQLVRVWLVAASAQKIKKTGPGENSKNKTGPLNVYSLRE